ncbi:hypothetical protein AAY473_008324 [Plecturocebus cupreus]
MSGALTSPLPDFFLPVRGGMLTSILTSSNCQARRAALPKPKSEPLSCLDPAMLPICLGSEPRCACTTWPRLSLCPGSLNPLQPLWPLRFFHMAGMRQAPGSWNERQQKKALKDKVWECPQEGFLCSFFKQRKQLRRQGKAHKALRVVTSTEAGTTGMSIFLWIQVTLELHVLQGQAICYQYPCSHPPLDEVLLCCPGWRGMAPSQLTATSASWVQAILMRQPRDDSLASASLVAGITGMCQHARLIFIFLAEMGLHHVGQTGLRPLTSSDLLILTFQNGIMGMSHRARLEVFPFKTCM